MGDEGEPELRAKSLFIFGLGYVGSRLANRVAGEGWRVGGSLRDLSKDASKAGDADIEFANNRTLDPRVRVAQVPLPEAAGEAVPSDALAEQEWRDIVREIEEEEEDDPSGASSAQWPRESRAGILRALRLLAGYEALLFTAPVAPDGLDPFLGDRWIGPAIRWLARSGRVTWAGYLSTTSVYGNADGEWVDEDSPLMPSLRRGELRVRAERAFLLESGLPMHVFRLPGIYGPGRGPMAKMRKRGEARSVVKAGQLFSRAHVDDIVGALCASIARPNPGRAYNVTDSEPAAAFEVNEFACALMGVPPPPREDFEEAKKTMSAMALSFYADCKRVRSDRLKAELGYELLFPTYREGFKAQLAEEMGNGWTIVDAAEPASPGAGRTEAVGSPRPPPATTTTTTDESRTTTATQATQTQLAGKSANGEQEQGWLGPLLAAYRWLLSNVVRPWAASAGRALGGWLPVLRGVLAAARAQWWWPFGGGGKRTRSPPPLVLLVDNGSLRPEPFRQLRTHAARLERRLRGEGEAAVARAQAQEQEQDPGPPSAAPAGDKAGGRTGPDAHAQGAVEAVVAVSARFSDRIDPALLDGVPGRSLAGLIAEWRAAPRDAPRSIVLLPYFLGPSSTSTEYAPRLLRAALAALPPGSAAKGLGGAPVLRVARPMVSSDGQLAAVLADSVMHLAAARGLRAPYAVVLVDHGSPSRAVNRTRRAVAAQLRAALGGNARCVVDCSMERRPGDAYAFNDPLLEHVFDLGGLGDGDVLLAMMFLAPGRHAGAGGDIAAILDAVRTTHPALRVHQTELVGDIERNGDRVLDILGKRLAVELSRL